MTAQLTLLAGTTRPHYAKEIGRAWQDAVDSILETGRLIAQAKANLAHGEFLAMIERDLPFARNTAERLMIIAQHPVISNGPNGPLLPPSWRTLYELTKLPVKTLEARIADGTINPGIERKDVVALRRDEGRHDEGAPAKLPGGPHADCVQLETLAKRWDDMELSNAVAKIMMAAGRAPDAPKQSGNPAEASHYTIMQLERWAVILKKGPRK